MPTLKINQCRAAAAVRCVVICALLLAAAQGWSQSLAEGNPPPQPRFMDKAQWSLLLAHTAVRSLDTAHTCHNLAVGGQELGLPVHTCSGVAAWNAGAVGIGVASAYFLHRQHHHKLGLLIPLALTAIDTVAWRTSR